MKQGRVSQTALTLGVTSLPEVLAKSDLWRNDVPAVFSAEGLFQYLTDDEVHGVLRDAASCSSTGRRLIFTHAIPETKRSVFVMAKLVGEPWKSAVRSEDLPEYGGGTGWTMISDVDTDSAHGVERYAVAERR